MLVQIHTGRDKQMNAKWYRNERHGFWKLALDSGPGIQVYDNGKIKLGMKDKKVIVDQVHNYREGVTTDGGGFITVHFEDADLT